jgi:hypothetical protein
MHFREWTSEGNAVSWSTCSHFRRLREGALPSGEARGLEVPAHPLLAFLIRMRCVNPREGECGI